MRLVFYKTFLNTLCLKTFCAKKTIPLNTQNIYVTIEEMDTLLFIYE